LSRFDIQRGFSALATAAWASVLLALPAGQARAGALPEEEYVLREPVAAVGSNIRKNVVWNSSIPLNRTYEQLTPDQRLRVNALYERIEPGDEPPFPAEGLKPIFHAIWKGAAKRNAVGRLTVVASVEPDGRVGKVEIFDDPDPHLSKFAASVLMLTSFKPALCKGAPCPMQYPFSIDIAAR
jgi:hypothetical protein